MIAGNDQRQTVVTSCVAAALGAGLSVGAVARQTGSAEIERHVAAAREAAGTHHPRFFECARPAQRLAPRPTARDASAAPTRREPPPRRTGTQNRPRCSTTCTSSGRGRSTLGRSPPPGASSSSIRSMTTTSRRRSSRDSGKSGWTRPTSHMSSSATGTVTTMAAHDGCSGSSVPAS